MGRSCCWSIRGYALGPLSLPTPSRTAGRNAIWGIEEMCVGQGLRAIVRTGWAQHEGLPNCRGDCGGPLWSGAEHTADQNLRGQGWKARECPSGEKRPSEKMGSRRQAPLGEKSLWEKTASRSECLSEKRAFRRKEPSERRAPQRKEPLGDRGPLIESSLSGAVQPILERGLNLANTMR